MTLSLCTVCLSLCLCVFFSFKQKTAYEMCISDWSSDVCSSDLQDRFPFAALMLAMHSIRELPDSERGAWRTWFDHYVFGNGAAHTVDHLPPHAQGVLGPPSPQRDRMIIDYVVGFCRSGGSG